jgi:hypothetical protein
VRVHYTVIVQRLRLLSLVLIVDYIWPRLMQPKRRVPCSAHRWQLPCNAPLGGYSGLPKPDVAMFRKRERLNTCPQPAGRVAPTSVHTVCGKLNREEGAGAVAPTPQAAGSGPDSSHRVFAPHPIGHTVREHAVYRNLPHLANRL